MAQAARKPAEMIVPYWAGKFPVLVTAHRGFSGEAPENTLPAFKKAIEVGSDMIELDVRFSKDGKIVVIHDDTLDRTTNGRGKVSDYTLKELKELDAGSWFAPQFSGEQIPTLKEVLELAKGKIPMNIEIKDDSPGQYKITDLADRALQEVKKAGMVGEVIFSSFYPSSLQRIKERDPRIWVALLYHREWNSLREVTGGRVFSVLNLRHSFLTREKIRRIHQEGMKVNTYTVNSEEEMEQFIGWGIDGIITNHPDKLIQILKKKFP
jgi:glycerophosphoryl diester phosphodiesterase